MLEAMSAGAAVLAADRPYAHDVCGTAAFYFDPLSPDHFAATAQMVLEDVALRRRLVERGIARATELRARQPYKEMVDTVFDAIN